jgi:hypothetical protein
VRLSVYYRQYWYYIFVGLAASIMGILFYNSYLLIESTVYNLGASKFSQFTRGANTRPFIEVIIALYYFYYFCVLPKFFLRSKNDLLYMFNMTVRIFQIVVLVGLIDVAQFIVTEENFIPRHLFDTAFVELGTRFHGLAGEPRDAFPYLIFGLSMYYLRKAIFRLIVVRKFVVSLACISLVLTQSASGLIGLIISGFLLLILNLRGSIKNAIEMFLILVILTICIVFVAVVTDRIFDYVLLAKDAFDALKSGEDLPTIIYSQSSNIFPMWQWYLYFTEYKIFPIIFGSGFGSASFINNSFTGAGELMNPNSNLIRIMYETGLIGIFYYITFQLLPIKDVTKLLGGTNGRITYFLGIFLIGACLGHRSTTIFIYCGILISILNIQSKEDFIVR